MVKFYVRRITIDKKMTIDDIPERWREQVRKAIEEAEAQSRDIIGRKPIKESALWKKNSEWNC